MHLVLSQANASFRAIMRYTRQRWGRDQSIVYASRLSNAMERLLGHPSSGVIRADINTYLRSISVEKHVIFYRIMPSYVYIVDILHQNMDHPYRL